MRKITILNIFIYLGTFDRLHVAHKLLLSDAILRAGEKVTVGVTEENMIHSRYYYDNY